MKQNILILRSFESWSSRKKRLDKEKVERDISFIRSQTGPRIRRKEAGAVKKDLKIEP